MARRSKKNDLQYLLKMGGHIYGGYIEGKLIAIGMLIPATEKSLKKVVLCRK